MKENKFHAIFSISIFMLVFIFITCSILFTNSSRADTVIIKECNGSKIEFHSQENIKTITSSIIKSEGISRFTLKKREVPDVESFILVEENADAKIPVFTFHRLSDEEFYSISKNNFENFLAFLDKNGFYFISPDNLFNKDFSSVPDGKKICMGTADDAASGQFVIKENNGRKIISADSMTGILLKKLPRQANNKINFI